MSTVQEFRSRALSALTDEIGVYALCDLDAQPIYVGQSVDGIRTRVRRHLTSARSDVIANRQIDVWEIAHVWAWPCAARADIAWLEQQVFSHYDAELPLMNGKVMATDEIEAERWPARQEVQVMSDEDIGQRRAPEQRLPRQIQQYQLLVDYILNVKEKEHLKRSLDAHFERLVRYHARFL